jgi:hypothetical protein
MRTLVAGVLIAVSGACLAQLGPSGGSTWRDGSQPAGTVLQPDQRLQTPQQPPPQNPQPFGGSIGGPIQETGNYGNLGLGGQKQPGVGGSSLVNPPQPQDPRIDERDPFQRR